MSARMRMLGAACLAACALGAAGVAGAAWPPDPYSGGVALGALGGNPAVIGDGGGGAFVVALGAGPRVQHVDANGVPLWPAGGVAAGSSGAAAVPGGCAMVLDGAGGVIVGWLGAGNRVYAQRLDAAGNLLWASTGVAVGGTSVDEFPVHLCGDGTGGAFFAWATDRLLHGQVLPPAAFVRRVDSSGLLPWAGEAVSTATTTQDLPAICSDGAGGAIVAWDENRGTASGSDIWAQRYNALGTAQWAANGVVVCNVTSDQYSPVMTSDGAGGAIVTWYDYREYVAPDYSVDFLAQRLSGSGTLLWFFGGLPLCREPWIRQDLTIASDGANGALVAWDDARDKIRFNVYTQHIASYGGMLWTADGLLVCNATGDKGEPGVAPDGAGGALVTWRDFRGVFDYDVYAAPVSAAGVVVGIPNGFPVAAAAADQTDPAIASDDHGGALVAWSDLRPGVGGNYVQRLDRFGLNGDPSPSITSVRDVPNDQGGKVKVSWLASYADGVLPAIYGINYPIQDYQVFRLVTPSTWLLEATVPSGPLPAYSAVVATAADSSGADPATAVFRVTARAPAMAGSPVWTSQPDSGHSVDNLPPPPPSGLASVSSGAGTLLSWSPVNAPDLAGYRVYRTASADSPISAASLLATVTAPSYLDDQAPTCEYAVASLDLRGNESPAARLAVTTSNGALRTYVLSLAAGEPNPARERTTFAIELPERAAPRLELFDVAGRRVRALEPGAMSAGPHRLEWDLRDDAGQTVRPGVYAVRLVTPQGHRLARLVVVR
jgi:hypothetical protein